MPRVVVYVRQPRPRDGKEDPPVVHWNTVKERELWSMLRAGGDTDVDWTALAAHFGVSVVYILQQTAWLYEKELRLLQQKMTQINVRASALAVPPTVPTLSSPLVSNEAKLGGQLGTPGGETIGTGGPIAIPGIPGAQSIIGTKPKPRPESAELVSVGGNDNDVTPIANRPAAAGIPSSPIWRKPNQLQSPTVSSGRNSPNAPLRTMGMSAYPGRRLLSASRTIESEGDSSSASGSLYSSIEDFVPREWHPSTREDTVSHSPNASSSSSSDNSVTQSALEEALMERVGAPK